MSINHAMYIHIYEIGLDRVSLNLNIYRSELNALGFPVLGVCTSLFPLHGPFYFSYEHLRLFVSSFHTHFLLPAISFFSTRNPIALYPLGYSRTISCETVRRSSRMGNRKCKAPMYSPTFQ